MRAATLALAWCAAVAAAALVHAPVLAAGALPAYCVPILAADKRAPPAELYSPEALSELPRLQALRPPARSAAPGTVIIGVQKGGTTSLASYLWTRGYCMPVPPNKKMEEGDCMRCKELHVLWSPLGKTGDSLAKRVGVAEAYARIFRNCSGKPTFDATPEYFHKELAPAKLASALPPEQKRSLRVVVSLREPLERSLSRFNDLVQSCLIKGTAFKCSQVCTQRGLCAKKPVSPNNIISLANYLVRNGDIGRQLEPGPLAGALGKQGSTAEAYLLGLRRWAKTYGRANLLVLDFVELVSDSQRALTRLDGFLGLERTAAAGAGELPHSNEHTFAAKKSAVSCDVWRHFGPRMDEGNQRLLRWLHCTQEQAPPEERGVWDPAGASVRALVDLWMSRDSECGTNIYNSSGQAVWA